MNKKIIISDPDDEVSHIYEVLVASEEVSEVEETQIIDAYD